MALATVPTFSFEELKQDMNAVSEAAVRGPVFITWPGRTAFVLLTREAYLELKVPTRSLADVFAMDEGEEIEFDAPRLTGSSYHPTDFLD